MTTTGSTNVTRDPKGKKWRTRIEERILRNHSIGGEDFEDYPGTGPLPVGDAPIHSEVQGGGSVNIGLDLDSTLGGNPGNVPNTKKPGSGYEQADTGSSPRPDETQE